jgi:adenosylcobinamide-GDP ribazoletransferase
MAESLPTPPRGWHREWRIAATALQFLTRVPVPARTGFDPAWLEASVRHFPLVGALVGAVGGAVLWTASIFWSPWVAALLALAATIALTGAFHEDGLADTFDALGGVVPREKALAIMKDSRIGTYGAVALGLGLALRVALMASLVTMAPVTAAAAVLLSHVLGRLAPALVMARLPYGGEAEHAKAKPLAMRISGAGVAVALGWALAAAVALGAAGVLHPVDHLLQAGVATLVVAALMTRWLRRRLGGFTGDGLGATEQLTEIAVLLVVARGMSV